MLNKHSQGENENRFSFIFTVFFFSFILLSNFQFLFFFYIISNLIVIKIQKELLIFSEAVVHIPKIDGTRKMILKLNLFYLNGVLRVVLYTVYCPQSLHSQMFTILLIRHIFSRRKKKIQEIEKRKRKIYSYTFISLQSLLLSNFHISTTRNL